MPKRHPDPIQKRQEIDHLLNLAEQGHADAQNILGARLAQGYFVEANLVGAVYWYAQAVKQGYTHAKWNIGTMLLKGEGVEAKNLILGMMLIEQAAEGGDPSACDFLAQCYASGKLGKDVSVVKSEEWRLRATDNSKFTEYGTPILIENYGIVLSKPQINVSDL